MSGKGWEFSCEGEGHHILLAALAALAPAGSPAGAQYVARVEFDDSALLDDEDGERVGDYVVVEVDGTVATFHPWSDEHGAPDPASDPVSVWVGDIRAVSVY